MIKGQGQKRGKAIACETMAKPLLNATLTTKYYHKQAEQSSENRAEKIARHRADMPRIYQATYDKAVSSKSLRATVNSFCAECCMWQREEVRLCTSLACPLWPYRPYRNKPKKTDKPEISSKNASEGLSLAPESKKTEQEDIG